MRQPFAGFFFRALAIEAISAVTRTMRHPLDGNRAEAVVEATREATKEEAEVEAIRAAAGVEDFRMVVRATGKGGEEEEAEEEGDSRETLAVSSCMGAWVMLFLLWQRYAGGREGDISPAWV